MKNFKHSSIDFCNLRLTKITTILLLFIILFAANSCSKITDSEKGVTQSKPIVKEKWHWGNPAKQNENAGYAQVVKVGNTIYISGVPSNDLTPEGITRLYNTLKKCLEAFGATPKDVVKETLYTTDIETMKKHNDARKKFYQGDYPAASWIQINKLYAPDAKLEVDLIAEITNDAK